MKKETYEYVTNTDKYKDIVKLHNSEFIISFKVEAVKKKYFGEKGSESNLFIELVSFFNIEDISIVTITINDDKSNQESEIFLNQHMKDIRVMNKIHYWNPQELMHLLYKEDGYNKTIRFNLPITDKDATIGVHCYVRATE